MGVKRFVAVDMRRALQSVRDELGPDAVILSNKRVAKGVEILATTDPISTELPVPAKSANPAASQGAGADASSRLATGSDGGAPATPLEDHSPAMRQFNPQQELTQVTRKTPEGSSVLERELDKIQAKARRQAMDIERELHADRERKLRETLASASARAAAVEAGLPQKKRDLMELLGETGSRQSHHSPAKVASQSGATESSDELGSLRKELNSMRQMLEMQLGEVAWNRFNQGAPTQASLWKRLRHMGLSGKSCQRIVQLVGDSESVAASWRTAIAHLSNQISVIDDTMLAEGGVYAFVGPTGAGKTTTIGKLAARYVIEHGADEVALVTTDTYRIAAHEQLRALGRILNVPVRVVDKGKTLEDVLAALHGKSLILIDTAGLSSDLSNGADQLRSLKRLDRAIKTYLTLPATVQAQAMLASYSAYCDAGLDACVITKIDEAVSLGEALNLVLEKRLPVAYITDGQAIPDDVHEAKAIALVTRAVEMMKLREPDEEAFRESYNESLAEDRRMTANGSFANY